MNPGSPIRWRKPGPRQPEWILLNDFQLTLLLLGSWHKHWVLSSGLRDTTDGWQCTDNLLGSAKGWKGEDEAWHASTHTAVVTSLGPCLVHQTFISLVCARQRASPVVKTGMTACSPPPGTLPSRGRGRCDTRWGCEIEWFRERHRDYIRRVQRRGNTSS